VVCVHRCAGSHVVVGLCCFRSELRLDARRYYCCYCHTKLRNSPGHPWRIAESDATQPSALRNIESASIIIVRTAPLGVPLVLLVRYAPLPPSLGCFEKRVAAKVTRYVGLLWFSSWCKISGEQRTPTWLEGRSRGVHDALCLQARVRQDSSKTDQIRLEQ
jgi:hypothetical protein